MANNRTPFGNQPDMLDTMDFDFNLGGNGKNAKEEKKRRPVTKIITNVGKGSLSHFTSEQFIRSTVARSLPRGYDTAIDAGFEIRDSASQLYNSAADEYRKLKPQLQRTVQRLMPTASKILPGALAKRLKSFSQGPTGYQAQVNPDEDLLRSVLGELETTRETERLREYTERSSREELKEQVEQRRFSSNIKALASIDKRLAHMQSFNDSVTARYQKRMLEVAYRQYFTQRDTLKLLAQEMPAQSEFLKAILHNTALPDMDKLTNRDRLHAGLRSKLMGLASPAAAGLGAMLKKNLMGRLQGGISGGASRVGGALSGMEMMSDANGMAKSMGMDTGGEIWKMIGGALTGAATSRLLGGFTKGMSPTGFTGQMGSKVGNLAKNWPELLQQWSGSKTKQTGMKGSLLSMLKGLVPAAPSRQRVGGSFIMEAGDAGMFTKKTQKSIETIIPGFLSKIHHELAMMRTGKHDIDQTVWNDDKETFTTKKQRTQDVEKRLFGDKTMANLRDKAYNTADFAAGGTTLSHGARHALSHSMVAHSVTNKPLSIKSILKNVPQEHRREVGRALRGNFTNAKTGARDDTRVGLLADMMRELKGATPNAAGMMEGFQQTGHIDDLRELGMLHEEGDDRFLDHSAWTKRALGGQQPDRGPNQYKRNDYAHMTAADKKKDTVSALGDTFVDLYKPHDLNTPVVNAIALQMKNYLNAKTKRKAIDLEDVLDGLTTKDGRTVVSSTDAKKLVTRDGRTLPEFVKELKSKPATSGGGRFSKLASKIGSVGNRIDLATGRAGAMVDNWADSRGYSARGGRKQATSDAHAFAQSAKSTVQQAAQSVKSGDAMRMAKQSADTWGGKLKSKWAHAVSVGQGAMDLYSAKGKKLIDAGLLKAGKYLSAKTGKPIRDVRDIVDGVKDESGHWVVDAKTATSELQTKGGEKFADLMDGLQTHMDIAKDAVGASATVQSALSMGKKASAGVQGAASAVHVQAAHAAAAAHEQIQQAGAPEGMAPLMELLEAFRDGNLQRLEGIGEVLTQILQNGGMGAGGGGAATPGKPFNFHTFLGKVVASPFKAASWLGRKGGKLYGKYVGGVFSGMHKLASGVLHTAASVFSSKALGKTAADVFVKGDRPWRPRLTKGAMEAGFYFNINPDGNLGKPIKVPKDIGGPVAEVVNGKQDTLISLEDYKKGLVDMQGKSLVAKILGGLWSATKTIGGFYGSLVTLPIKALMGVGRFVKNVVNYMHSPQDVYVKGDNPWEPRLYALGMRRGQYVLEDKPRKRVRTVGDITGPVMDVSKPQPEVVLKNEDLANICMRNGKPFKLKAGILVRVAGGALNLAGNVAAGMVHLAGHVARLGYHALALPFRGLAHVLGMGGRKFKAPKGGLPTHDEKVFGALSGIQTLLKSRLPQPQHHRMGNAADILKHDAAEESAEDAAYNARMGKTKPTTGAAAKTGGGGIFSDLKNGVKDVKQFMSGMKNLKNLMKDSKWLKKGWNAIRGIKNVGSVAGEAAEVGEGALGAGEAVAGGTAIAGEVAAGAGAAEGIAVAGGGLAAAGGAIAAGAAAVGGGILTVLASPFVLVAAAVAAVGYLAYKGYSDHKLRALKLRALRMAQYGVDVDRDLGNSKKIDQLESILIPVTSTSGGKASINLKAIKPEQTKQIIKILGLYTSKAGSSVLNPMNWFHRNANAEDVQNSKNAQSWLDQRFKTVFCTWMGAAHDNGNVKLQDLDDKLTKKEQRDGLLKSVMMIEKTVYAQMASPFPGDNLTAGATEVDARYKIAVADEKGTLAKAGGAIASAAKAAGALLKKAGGAVMAAVKSPLGKKVMSGLATAGKVIASGLGLGAAAGAIEAFMNKTGDGKAPPKVGLKKTANLPKFTFLGGTMQALTAVRYKTYGLTDMDTTKVKAMFMLEQDVFQKIQYEGGVTAKFSDDASYYFNQYSGYFGVSPSDNDAKLRWYAWFAKRFIPSILQFCTAVKNASKTVDPRDAESYLGPPHLLDVATSTIAATNGSGLFASSVWSYTDTPFDDKMPLNKDSDSTKDNIQVLKDKVKSQTIAQQSSGKNDPNAKPKGVVASIWDQAKSVATSASNAVKAAVGIKVAAQPKAPPVPQGPEQGSSAAASIASAGPSSPVGQAVKQPGNGTAGDVNKVPMPTGSGSYAAVEGTLDAAAKMTGVDPKLLGTFTGIESGWRPSAHAPTSSASGLGQFIDSTWRSMLAKYGAKYGIAPNTPQTDPRASALMLGEFIKDNQSYLQKHLGRAPTDTELYMAHFLGPAGAVDLLKAGGTAIAAAVNPKAAGSNQTIFYKGGQALSVADVTKILDKKVSTYRGKVGGGGAAPSAVASASTPTLPNGAKTTTTANGPTGGIGGAAKAAGAASPASTAVAAATPSKSTNGMAGIQPPSGGKAPPSAAALASTGSGGSASAPDPVAAYQSQQQQSAVAQDRQAQASQASSAAQGTQAIGIQQQQTTLLQQVVQLLGKIEGHTGQIGDLANANGSSSTTPTGAVKSGDAVPTTAGGATGVPTSATLPPPVVPVNRPVYT
jgi:hypothetical protein